MTSKRRTSRRQFLAGVSAKEALADALHGGAESDLPPPAKRLLTHFSSRAMACEFEVILNHRDAPIGAEPALDALGLVEQLEDQLTVYRDHSEISQLNRTASLRPVPVEADLFDLLMLAQEVSRETHGAFDLTAGPLSKVWGFFRRSGGVPATADLDAALSRVGFDLVALDPADRSVRFLADGVELNLGAIGKGYALDRCATLLKTRDVDHFLLHGGRSSLYAQGSRGDIVDSPSPGWPIAVRHPLRGKQRLGTITLQNQGLGTSGCGNQFFHHHGKRFGHILDPRSGAPAEQAVAVTVVAPTGALADALSTAFYVLGVDEAAAYCDCHPEVNCLFVTIGERENSIDVTEIGLNSDCWVPTTD
ncbi:MAG: FAD:protein FMN transferase [Pirellulaceae bacterium]|jgi:thiamine biosynthesis lipoprotein|nr:FAD:protein FMN transferase [Pirellulaceae bacterium]MDP7017137.1 FAD:protein FMN transferase [Pirellulaceae bacterium]